MADKHSKRVTFDHSQFRRSHGKNASGWGCWAFEVPEWRKGEIIWITPACTMSECKARIAEIVKAPVGHEIVAVVMP